jgi:hypothetical protein
MCPLCTTTAVLTAATATTSASVIAAWGIDLSEPILARWQALKRWLLRQLRHESNTTVGARNEH